MSLKLDLAQTVVIGRFNPYIIAPAWLVNEGVCDETADTDERSDGDDYLDASPAPMAFELGGYEWEAGFDRLAVSASDPGQDCGAMAVAVLERLHHTPVEAVGNNFVFICDLATWADRPTPGLTGAGSFPPPTEARWVGLYRENGERIEVELTVVPNKVVVVRLNFDCRVDGSADAQRAAGEFRNDYARAARMVRDLFRIEVP